MAEKAPAQEARGPAGDPLEVLRVVTRLEVGPVRLEARRLLCPYRVAANDRKEAMDLIFRFEEDVFDPSDPSCRNLADMLAVQVAMNYGLFCGEIVFHGLYDEQDKRFIREMTAHTCREIFVKKFLQPNPFLTGKAASLPPVKLESYLRAHLLFPESEAFSERSGRSWNTDPSRHAILSSGGKDSLLSFGLLREMGFEVHPLFVNESGRHWFTALNAYRYFSTHIPRTARVWTNADRVFNWMLRHFPFIRKDYARLRSDEYPVRIWTVAVFLFGVLPLMKKRGIGRLIIGDEFDTTRRLSHKGITHYDGLYDQSRNFDNALTRYFRRKRWDFSQFSVLRPLSELLIQKTLAERYPDLQQHQVSCHAAHKAGDRIRPCGRCEKCRRIVSMLSAIGVDPAGSGYTPEQVRSCLKDLETQEIHQESVSVEHVAALLREKGLIEAPFIGKIHARRRPEVVKLRFDPERSPMEEIPTDLRASLYRICLEHAEGAVLRRGRLWLDFDPLADPALMGPYPFERPFPEKPGGHQAQAKGAIRPVTPVLGELTWPEALRRFKEVDVALLPVGSIEQHGPHLPLDTDAFDAYYLALRVAEACRDPKPLVLPLIPYGVSYHHEDFSGTLSASPDTLSRLVYDIGTGVARHGITKLVIINGHGGNSPALHFAAQMINRDAHIFTCVDTGETSDPDVDALAETPNDVHAGEIETSTALAVRPSLVRMEAAKKFVPRFSSRYLDFTSKRSVGWYARVAKLSPQGILGDPTKADEEKGRRMWDIMIKNLVELVEELQVLTLDEIYQRRY